MNTSESKVQNQLWAMNARFSKMEDDLEGNIVPDNEDNDSERFQPPPSTDNHLKDEPFEELLDPNVRHSENYTNN